MVTDRKRQSQFTKWAISACVCGILLLLLLVSGSEQTFPALPVGSYVGTVRGVPELGNKEQGNKDAATWYVERLNNSNKLLVVLFNDGWNPAIVEGVPRQNSSTTEKNVFEPLAIQLVDSRYLLFGEENGGSYSGETALGEETIGSWKLDRLRMKEVQSGVANTETALLDLTQWLPIRLAYWEALNEGNRLVKQRDEAEKHLKKLVSYVDDEDSLRERAQKSREQLQEKVTQAGEERTKARKTISKLVSELDLLSRISERGKTIRMGRKVANRENKWYFANWRADDTGNMEEVLGDRLKIDLKTHGNEIQKAREIKGLLRQITAEREAIRELEYAFEQKLNPQQPAPTEKAPEPEENRSIWDKLFRKKEKNTLSEDA